MKLKKNINYYYKKQENTFILKVYLKMFLKVDLNPIC